MNIFQTLWKEITGAVAAFDATPVGKVLSTIASEVETELGKLASGDLANMTTAVTAAALASAATGGGEAAVVAAAITAAKAQATVDSVQLTTQALVTLSAGVAANVLTAQNPPAAVVNTNVTQSNLPSQTGPQ